MSQRIYQHEPLSERGSRRAGGDDGLYRIAVYIKHNDGRKEFSHYLEGEYDKKTALLKASELNSRNNP
jgi:hypothetical protein